MRRGRKPLDLAGMWFGCLLAIRPTDRKSGSAVVWLCRCSCGREAMVSAGHLRYGEVKSCGHLIPVGMRSMLRNGRKKALKTIKAKSFVKRLKELGL